MAREYTKVEELAEVVRTRHEHGGNICRDSHQLWIREEATEKAHGTAEKEGAEDCSGLHPTPQGRPRKESASEEVKRNNEIAQLRMQVELLQNFLFEAGRR